jgi:predicted patatin/cPLA2 family phospholipase
LVTLVIEGGASRAAYASGVAASLAHAGLVPDAVYGTSAGGAIGAWFAAGQVEVGVRTWDRVTDRSLLSFRRVLVGSRPVLDFRRLYSEYYPTVFGMDVARLRAAPFPVFVTVTDADTAETDYIDLRTTADPFVALHATSALPLVSEAPVVIDGRRWVDGGASDPIPIARAIADGARDVLCILNRPPGERRPESRVMVALVARRFPALAQAARDHHKLHAAAVALAERPPDGVRVRIVRPSEDLGISRFTRDVRVLHAAVERGRRDGREAAAALAA